MEKNNPGQYSGRKRLQFCAQSDPLGKRINFHKNFKHFYKKRKKLAPPKVKNYVWSRSKNFDFFDLKNFHSKLYENEKIRKCLKFFRSQNFRNFSFKIV